MIASGHEGSALFIINSVAPIRICDNGGWTDTWFAGHGRIFNIAVSPSVEVQLAVYPIAARQQRVVINAENYGDRYGIDPKALNAGRWERHPLLEAAIAYMGLPEDIAIEASIHSEAPAGASTGTSAAVTVALIGALDGLTPGRMAPHEVALAAQKVETDLLGGQCGVQDQLCSAYGGINYIEIHNYPYASVSQVRVPNDTWWELERRLALVYLGKSHHSSQVHEMVIRSLEDAGPESLQLADLRQTAACSRDALYDADFAALGQAMIDNHEAQRRLHPALISADAEQVIAIARQNGAMGWKVNGAGGEGGSLTLLCGRRSDIKRKMLREIEASNPLWAHIPTNLSRYGLRVWKRRIEHR